MKVGGALRVLVAGGVAAGLVYGAGRADGQVHLARAADRTVVAAGVSSALRSASVACPGPDRGGLHGSTDPQAARQQVTLLSTSAPLGVLPAGVRAAGDGGASAVSLPGAAAAVRTTRAGTVATLVSGDRAIRLDTTGGLAPGSTSTQYSYDSIRSARGMSFLQCTAAVQDAWVLAGGDEPGRVTRLVLANPGSSAITVAATVLGSAGRDPGSVAGTVVAPGHRVVLTLGTLRSGRDPVIHVTSSGGPVSVAATDVWMDGETQIGEETAGVSAAPATTQVLPAVTVLGPEPVVRVADPGTQDAVVRVRATGSDGAIATEQVLTVPAGRTGSIGLRGLVPGDYSVQVLSDEPVVAAASVRSTATGVGDITWATGVPVTRTLTGTGLPVGLAGGDALLGVTATSSTAQVVVSTVDARGGVTSTTRSLTAGAPLLQRLPAATSVWVSVRSGSVRAAVSVRGKDQGGPLFATTALAPLPLTAQIPAIRPAGG
ncbi:DUF5719 family protein [Allobranchiibius sp. CTAmp26]|uniref:DUF5719 family protein n=1 Tax=Allobranchiibius sp. CTAmp26 TaxID=2815214 RepID=UPI001AA0F024|nr:DUF5719 family protein [Allobranchiibius sp. CTAmp26]MBO1755606.1 hypothetical protein [Allobranchiibius sp. CTAmp26]